MKTEPEIPPRQNGCPPGKSPSKRLLDQARRVTATGFGGSRGIKYSRKVQT